MKRVLSGSLLLAISVPLAVPAQEMMTVDIKEYDVPWQNTRPRDPFVGPDGLVWFVGQVGNYIARLDPATGEFKRYEIEEGTNPHNLIVDERGVWYAGNANGRVGRLDPATGALEIFPMPDAAARDPHTLMFRPDGTLWFTVQNGAFIGHLDPRSKQVRLVKTADRSGPYGIKVDSHGNPWVVLFGTNKLATIDAATMQLRTIDLPRTEARPRRMEITPDQRVWYVDYAAGMLGVYDPKSGQFEEWPSPGGPASQPYGTALDDKGRIWYVEGGSDPNHLIGFDPATKRFFSSTPIANRGTVRHMMFDARTRTIWFGADKGTIGRAIIPE